MTHSAWWKFAWVWSVPALLVFLNGLWLFGLRGAVVGQGGRINEQLRAKEQQVKELQRAVAELESTQSKLAQVQKQLVELRVQEMGPMRTRLIPFLSEVGARVRKVGLFPERISYSASQDKKSGLVHFTATFEVTGSYEQLRQCISELERVPQFLVIERLGLQGEDVARSTDVALRLVVGTYFSDLDPELLTSLGVRETRDAGE